MSASTSPRSECPCPGPALPSQRRSRARPAPTGGWLSAASAAEADHWCARCTAGAPDVCRERPGVAAAEQERPHLAGPGGAVSACWVRSNL